MNRDPKQVALYKDPEKVSEVLEDVIIKCPSCGQYSPAEQWAIEGSVA